MPDLVLLHGFTQTGRTWQAIAHALAGRYRAVAPDLPGHGAFAERRPASFAATDAYLRALGDGAPLTLCGYSMGGRVALHAAAARRSARCARLVLIGASPGLADPAERAARARDDAALAARIGTIGVDAFVREWGAQPLFAGMPRGVAELVDEDRRRNTAAGLAAALRGLGTGVMPSLWDRLGTLACPSRWSWGSATRSSGRSRSGWRRRCRRRRCTWSRARGTRRTWRHRTCRCRAISTGQGTSLARDGGVERPGAARRASTSIESK